MVKADHLCTGEGCGHGSGRRRTCGPVRRGARMAWWADRLWKEHKGEGRWENQELSQSRDGELR